MDERITRFLIGISVGILAAWLIIKIYTAFPGHPAGMPMYTPAASKAVQEGPIPPDQMKQLREEARARQADAHQQMVQANEALGEMQRREEAWRRFYVPTPACRENIFGPGCSEAKLKARKAFDAKYPPPRVP